MRLAARYIEPLWAQIGGAGAREFSVGPLRTERTLDQAVTFANTLTEGAAGVLNAFTGSFTGDPEIDNILALFMRPMRCRST